MNQLNGELKEEVNRDFYRDILLWNKSIPDLFNEEIINDLC